MGENNREIPRDKTQAIKNTREAKKAMETGRQNDQRAKDNEKNWQERLQRKREEAEAAIAAAEQAKLNGDAGADERAIEAQVAVDKFFDECHRMISEGVKGYDTLLSTGGQMVTWSVLLADALHSQHQADRHLFNLIGAILTSPMMAIDAAKWVADSDVVYNAGEKMGDLLHGFWPKSNLGVSDASLDLSSLIEVGENGTLTVQPIPKLEGVDPKEHELLNQFIKSFVYMSMMKREYKPEENAETHEITWAINSAAKESKPNPLTSKDEVIACINKELGADVGESLNNVKIQKLADALEHRPEPPSASF
ncbi:MAG: hypothetical protein K0U24_04175 [Gammaproteobacteria bacterium]|nr:hypothetical protein [Gammaproteobacteria bacterium]MCH9716072.1 hypothetical protein [Gammaproteobacteria bacterium]MCH9763411.1 hypothetical protein [Gammaproteobacteria bacterium]